MATLIFQLSNPHNGFKYVAINCNHRLHVWKRKEISTTKCLVFPASIIPEEYELITSSANEFHDSYSVHMTEFEKYMKIVQKLEHYEKVCSLAIQQPIF